MRDEGSSTKAEAAQAKASRGRRARRAVLIGLAGVAVEVAGLRRQGYGFGGRVIVSCRKGHLFSTIWIPGVSVKAARLGWVRFQRCPAGRHWSLVKPVREADLSEEARQLARQCQDVPLP